jgi:hypothetical protein
MSLTIDISELKFQELSELRERIEARVQEMREIGAPALREKFSEEAAAYGLTVEEVMQTAKARRGRPPNSGKQHAAEFDA